MCPNIVPMETIRTRIYEKDLNKLKRLIPPRKDETLANFMSRAVDYIEDAKEILRK